VSGLRGRGVDECIIEQISAGTSYFGTCLGLQALFESSPEAPGVAGLGLIPGHCEKLAVSDGIKIPHMGWNKLELTHGGHPCLEAAGGEQAWVYFVHSYHGVPSDPQMVKAVVRHGPHRVTAAVGRDNIFATQFHPEKSQTVGLKLLSEFLDQ
jgi:glutamine amidotransferase